MSIPQMLYEDNFTILLIPSLRSIGVYQSLSELRTEQTAEFNPEFQVLFRSTVLNRYSPGSIQAALE